MWILITIILELSSANSYSLNYEKPILHKTYQGCMNNMDAIFLELKKLKANYPIELSFEVNLDNIKYIKYSYKPDYTKPNVEKYYHCKKL